MSGNEILQLFSPTGEKISASRNDLLQIEGQSFKKKFYRRVLGENPGTYWLISARPGHVRMVLEVHWSKHPTREEWSIGYCSNGIASYGHWDIDSAIRTFTERRQPIGSSGIGFTVIPPNVEALAREHIYFVDGAEDETAGPRPQFSLKTVNEAKMSANLARIAPSADASQLLKLAGRPVEIMELGLAAAFFCGDNRLEEQEAKVMIAMIPLRSRLRLHSLMNLAGTQIAD